MLVGYRLGVAERDARPRPHDQAAAASVDVVVLVFGEEVYAEKPGDIEVSL